MNIRVAIVICHIFIYFFSTCTNTYYTHLHTCTCGYTCLHTCTCGYTYSHTHIHTYICLHLYSNTYIAGAKSEDDCSPCLGGHYCENSGLSTPTGLCEAGYYCPSNFTISDPQPNGLLCPAGLTFNFYCLLISQLY